MKITATEGKDRFGYDLRQAVREPVEIVGNGSVEQHKLLEHRRRAFRNQFKSWIDDQNAHTEAHGVWCEGLVAWPQARD